MANGRGPQPAPSFSPHAPEAAGSLTSTSHNLQIPAPNANVDGLSNRPLNPPVPHEAMGSTTAGLKADAGRHFLVPLKPHKAVGSITAGLKSDYDA